jgi:hypothetical protein
LKDGHRVDDEKRPVLETLALKQNRKASVLVFFGMLVPTLAVARVLHVPAHMGTKLNIRVVNLAIADCFEVSTKLFQDTGQPSSF